MIPGRPEKEAQFYSMLGQRAIYYQGWLANTLHPPLSGWRKFEHDVWELYNLKEDRSQIHDLADREPGHRSKNSKGYGIYYAGVYKGLPLDDRRPLEIVTTPRPQPSKPRNRYIYYPDTADVPEMVAVNIRGRSYTIAAGAVIDTPEAEGVLFAHGGVPGVTACTSRTGSCTTSITGWGRSSRRSRQMWRSPQESTSSLRSS